MPLRTFQTVQYYDMGLGGQAIRYLGYSGHGTYTVTQVLAPAGRQRRKQKDICLDALEDAIDAGDEPGEVSKARVTEAEERWKLEQGQVQ